MFDMFRLREATDHHFRHELVPAVEIADEITEHGRYYTTPDGARYPSVTTVIGRYKGKAHLDEWRKRVGEEEARKITGTAQIRGRAVHLLAERFVMNDPDWSVGAMPANLYTFRPVIQILRERVGTVMGVEFPLWSDRLRTAGRTDLVCEWDGEPAIVDFKTSRKPKKEEHIWGYLVQKTCYAVMFEERTGRRISKIVTVMPVDHEEPSIWVKDKDDYVEQVEEVFARRLWSADPGLRCPG